MMIRSERHEGRRYAYVVTAHHVITRQLEIAVETSDTDKPGELHEPMRVENWRQPIRDVDLAIAPFPPRDVSPLAIEFEEHLPPDQELAMPRPGSQIFYLGVFQPLDRVMARSGTIGATNQLGLAHQGGYAYPAHLVDCRSYSGFSGSPCFLEVAYIDGSNELAYAHLLCGVSRGTSQTRSPPKVQ